MMEPRGDATPRRKADRIAAKLPVSLPGLGLGTTTNISASGVFFVTDVDVAPGSPVSFSIELSSGSVRMVLECTGEIVRVERAGGKTGLAARIVESRLERKPGKEKNGAHSPL